jgi:hypothetical protein
MHFADIEQNFEKMTQRFSSKQVSPNNDRYSHFNDFNDEQHQLCFASDSSAICSAVFASPGTIDCSREFLTCFCDFTNTEHDHKTREACARRPACEADGDRDDVLTTGNGSRQLLRDANNGHLTGKQSTIRWHVWQHSPCRDKHDKLLTFTRFSRRDVRLHIFTCLVLVRTAIGRRALDERTRVVPKRVVGERITTTSHNSNETEELSAAYFKCPRAQCFERCVDRSRAQLSRRRLCRCHVALTLRRNGK